VEDMADFLVYVCRFAQHGHNRPLDNERLDELMSLFVLLLGSPEYVKNPYLRAKFVEVLQFWLPGDPEDPKGRWNPRMANLFEGHPLALAHLVPAVLRLYVDIEFTGAANQFYDKFNIRYQIGEICEYLWKVEPHRRAWGQLAVNDSAFYMRFLNMLINDAIWLLDESLKKLPEVREFDAEQADAAAWAARPSRERAEREGANRSTERGLRNDLTLANVHVRMMGYTSRDIAAPFLLPEMVERVAAMLNYFLLFLAGPKRRELKVKDPEKYGWNPKELLALIADVVGLYKLNPVGPQRLKAPGVSWRLFGPVCQRIEKSEGQTGAIAPCLARHKLY
jgi:ubiquitin conjugation factor E4 B